VREVAAALAAPRQKAALNEAAAPMREDAQERLQANLQGRLRKLICQGLGYLDLSDVCTASQLEPALSCIKLLIHRFKVRSPLEDAQAAKQWLRLQGLLTVEVASENEANLESSSPEENGRGISIQTTERKMTMTQAEKASAKGGVYTPNVKVQNNQHVLNTGEEVILKCRKCGVELRSSWIIQLRGQAFTLVPHKGHTSCHGKYVATAATTKIKADNSTNLDYCPHGTESRLCPKCDGSGICVHKKRMYRCPICRPGGYQKHILQNSIRRERRRTKCLSLRLHSNLVHSSRFSQEARSFGIFPHARNQ
jgi:hypothetical protein